MDKRIKFCEENKTNIELNVCIIKIDDTEYIIFKGVNCMNVIKHQQVIEPSEGYEFEIDENYRPPPYRDPAEYDVRYHK